MRKLKMKMLFAAMLTAAASFASAQEVKEIPGWPKPGADVPSACASMYGAWVGEWGWGIGNAYLWILEVRGDGSKCAVTLTYGGYKTPPPRGNKWLRSESMDSDGDMQLSCGEFGGTCWFSRKGERVEGSYRNSQGGSNNATFNRYNWPEPASKK